eukprot:Lankesteria_metandrocarpae@DN5175_c0_g1_i1.p1
MYSNEVFSLADGEIPEKYPLVDGGTENSNFAVNCAQSYPSTIAPSLSSVGAPYVEQQLPGTATEVATSGNTERDTRTFATTATQTNNADLSSLRIKSTAMVHNSENEPRAARIRRSEIVLPFHRTTLASKEGEDSTPSTRPMVGWQSTESNSFGSTTRVVLPLTVRRKGLPHTNRQSEEPLTAMMGVDEDLRHYHHSHRHSSLGAALADTGHGGGVDSRPTSGTTGLDIIDRGCSAAVVKPQRAQPYGSRTSTTFTNTPLLHDKSISSLRDRSVVAHSYTGDTTPVVVSSNGGRVMTAEHTLNFSSRISSDLGMGSRLQRGNASAARGAGFRDEGERCISAAPAAMDTTACEDLVLQQSVERKVTAAVSGEIVTVDERTEHSASDLFGMHWIPQNLDPAYIRQHVIQSANSDLFNGVSVAVDERRSLLGSTTRVPLNSLTAGAGVHMPASSHGRDSREALYAIGQPRTRFASNSHFSMGRLQAGDSSALLYGGAAPSRRFSPLPLLGGNNDTTTAAASLGGRQPAERFVRNITVPTRGMATTGAMHFVWESPMIDPAGKVGTLSMGTGDDRPCQGDTLNTCIGQQLPVYRDGDAVIRLSSELDHTTLGRSNSLTLHSNNTNQIQTSEKVVTTLFNTEQEQLSRPPCYSEVATSQQHSRHSDSVTQKGNAVNSSGNAGSGAMPYDCSPQEKNMANESLSFAVSAAYDGASSNGAMESTLLPMGQQQSNLIRGAIDLTSVQNAITQKWTASCPVETVEHGREESLHTASRFVRSGSNYRAGVQVETAAQSLMLRKQSSSTTATTKAPRVDTGNRVSFPVLNDSQNTQQLNPPVDNDAAASLVAGHEFNLSTPALVTDRTYHRPYTTYCPGVSTGLPAGGLPRQSFVFNTDRRRSMVTPSYPLFKPSAHAAIPFSPRSMQSTAAAPHNLVHLSEHPPSSFTAHRTIGSGSFGTVYLAQVAGTGATVAIKRVFQDRRYKNRELQILSSLLHPCIVPFLHAFVTSTAGGGHNESLKGNDLHLVMPYVGDTLSRLTKASSKFPTAHIPLMNIRLYAYQICRALAYIHHKGICHRDIKPQNLLIDRRTRQLQLCDFGSAKKLISGETNVAYICSRYYRAPELIFGSTTYSTSIDVWSAGCVIAELFVRHPIFQGRTGVDQLVDIIKFLGNPSAAELTAMSPKFASFKFPHVKAVDWNEAFGEAIPEDAKDLISKMMRYAPPDRICPLEALGHEFFDQLREPGATMADGNRVHNIFNFTAEELSGCSEELKRKLIPRWACNDPATLEYLKQKQVETLIPWCYDVPTNESQVRPHLGDGGNNLNRSSPVIPTEFKTDDHHSSSVPPATATTTTTTTTIATAATTTAATTTTATEGSAHGVAEDERHPRRCLHDCCRRKSRRCSFVSCLE